MKQKEVPNEVRKKMQLKENKICGETLGNFKKRKRVEVNSKNK